MKRGVARLSLVLGLIAAFALVAASVAWGYIDFATPGKAAYCYVAAGEVNYTPNPALVCYTPNDGFTVTMRSGSRVTKRYVAENKWAFATPLRTLKYGQSFWASDSGDNTYTGLGTPKDTGLVGPVLYRCWSRSTGLTCKNRAGHGWWLGRYRGYRIY